ncbi:tRNA adenosine(34) deaminase TadA [Psychrobacter frigidicola]|uniref:tRNA adenosine(34) deaminase TadA n=1 Tax=Psychrobacter frigidicola TaxID=45611 RepID=UPI001D0F91DE|nr:tRNA adenosine(34) deaminase TadA [Psychrobacter frigidicola]
MPPYQFLKPYYNAAGDEISHRTFWTLEDVKWMGCALALAQRGGERGEVPVGAVLIHEHEVIGSGFNEPIGRHDATAHAEIVALRAACLSLNNYRLPSDTTLYVTLEPCTMCVGALIHARVDRLVYAASEPRAGMVGSQMNLPVQPFYNHYMRANQGLCAQHSSQILKDFFRKRRQLTKKNKQSLS